MTEVRQTFLCACGSIDNEEPSQMVVTEELQAVSQNAQGHVYQCPRCGERSVFSAVPDPDNKDLLWQATLVRLSKSGGVKKP